VRDSASPGALLEPLGHRERRVWPADPSAYGPRRVTRGGAYEVFIPARIADRAFPLGDEASAAIAQATKALGQLSAMTPRLASLDALARNVLRSESVASSRIEGVVISHKRLARAAYATEHSRTADRRAAEVLGNVEAMQLAIDIGARNEPFTVDDVTEVHRTLLHYVDDEEIAGVIRDKQSWIGGNDYNPVGAPFVPPPPEHVRPLLDDLCRFSARDDLAAVTQAAVAHAQFENIHPFADGNGRTGRALIYTILRRRGEIATFVPPVSLVLASQPKAYIGGLGAYSEGRIDIWCERMAVATTRACETARRVAFLIEERAQQWLDKLGRPRQDSAVRQLVRELPAHPVLDVAAGQQLTGKSHVAVGNALHQLESAGILQRLNEKKWGRVWECGELLDLVAEFEQDVSTP
jgi:Fic family protein